MICIFVSDIKKQNIDKCKYVMLQTYLTKLET